MNGHFLIYESSHPSRHGEWPMSMTLVRSYASLTLTTRAWLSALQLAEAYGWTPNGTSLKESEWDGSYDSNDGAEVSELDARNLASAIEHALPDVPRHESISHDTIIIGGAIEIRVIDTSARHGLFEVFSGKSRLILSELAEFFMRGAFRIC